MIAVDSSTVIAFFKNQPGPDMALFQTNLSLRKLALPPITLSETLSDPKLSHDARNLLKTMIVLIPDEFYWHRAGEMRSFLITKGYRPKLPDTLIAQSCLDYKVPLLTRDTDFQKYEDHCGLKLLK